VKQYDAGPFRRWKVSELIDLVFERPALFAPGTSWSFSDTNFMLLREARWAALSATGGSTTTPRCSGTTAWSPTRPSKWTAVVAFTAQGPKGDPLVAYASAFANGIGKLIDPKHPLDLAVCPRPRC
jgi:hypothetical protein